MVKVKVTKKEMKENYIVLSVGYCDMQFLLKHKQAFAYSAGVNGWSCDYYVLNIEGKEVVISTGYSPIPSKNISIDYDTIKEYENKAKNIDYTTYEEHKEKTDALLVELLKKGLEAK